MNQPTPPPDELAEWRRLASEATPGPWCLPPAAWDEPDTVVDTSTLKRVAQCVRIAKDADAAFIAASREALPRLIDAYLNMGYAYRDRGAMLSAAARDLATAERARDEATAEVERLSVGRPSVPLPKDGG